MSTKISTITYVKSPEEINGIKVVNSAPDAFEALMNGEEVMRYERGTSMEPILKDGEYAHLKPINSLDEVNIGDAVFCKVHGYLMTHMVLMKSSTGADHPYFLIGSSRYEFYGWTDQIYAIAYGTDVCEEDENVEFANIV